MSWYGGTYMPHREKHGKWVAEKAVYEPSDMQAAEAGYRKD